MVCNDGARAPGGGMAKLTLSFKERKLKVFSLTEGETLIGRDPRCAIHIDSLAIEPHHARISPAGDGFSIEACDDNAVVRVNGEPLAEATLLNDGDEIRIGKHSLDFSEEMDATLVDINVARAPRVGWVQIQNGSHLGRTIRLDKAFTRIGKPRAELAVIARRGDGYVLSHLHGERQPRVNGKTIGDQAQRLENGDRLEVGDLALQFFTDAEAGRQSDIPALEQEDGRQRRFSRIPFDVTVTLRSGEQRWESELIDLSLHGALVRTPQGLVAETGAPYELAVHLEGGPDIHMAVKIVHQENGRLGLVCEDIDVESITHLRRLVELNLGDPQLLERELSALG